MYKIWTNRRLNPQRVCLQHSLRLTIYRWNTIVINEFLVVHSITKSFGWNPRKICPCWIIASHLLERRSSILKMHFSHSKIKQKSTDKFMSYQTWTWILMRTFLILISKILYIIELFYQKQFYILPSVLMIQQETKH